MLPSIIYGDFNSQIKNDQDKYGVQGNKKKVGNNGEKLYAWLDKWGKTIVNNQSQTEGIWTWQENGST